ncbi:hypothetical protein BV913_03095 [Neisseria dumasiana]|uniref:Uncharacterized protein n=1 Tax=Neisseria dumasiana TaxID=1931275 RepID=A0ABX3WPS5_9NEIS|nr:hypothetical protein BV913_03095 [Neisseria dumasiana]
MPERPSEKRIGPFVRMGRGGLPGCGKALAVWLADGRMLFAALAFFIRRHTCLKAVYLEIRYNARLFLTE